MKDNVKSALIDQVKTAIHDSSAHGITKTIGQRKLYIKLLWLLAFLLFLSGFFIGFFGIIQRFQSKPIGTTFEAEKDEFVFPDVYLCPETPVSGSLPYLLNKTQADEFEKHLSKYDAVVQELNNIHGTSHLAVVHVLHSLPFKLVADTIAHTRPQFVPLIGYQGQAKYANISLSIFHHPTHIKCFKAVIPRRIKRELSSSISSIYMYLFLDPYNAYLPKEGIQLSKLYDSNLKKMLPTSWNFGAFHMDNPTGVRIYLTAENEYPHAQSKNFLLAPGRHYDVKITMLNTENAESLHHTCISNVPDIEFYDLYNHSNTFKMKYSRGTCLSETRNQLVEKELDCIEYNTIKSVKFRESRICTNIYQTNITYYYRKALENKKVIENIVPKIFRNCVDKNPCFQSSYTTDISSGSWPSMGNIENILNLINSWMAMTNENPASYPGLQYIINLSNATEHGVQFIPDVTLKEQKAIREKLVLNSLLKVVLTSTEHKSTRIVCSISYGFTNFLSDTGGLLGICIGGSFMTVFELLEFLHNIIDYFVQMKRSKTANKVKEMVDSDQVVEATSKTV